MAFLFYLNSPTKVLAIQGQTTETKYESWFVQSPEAWSQEVFGKATGEVFKERYTLSILTDIMNSTIAAIGGVETTVQTPQGAIQQRQGGAAQTLANLTGALYTAPPASSVEYLADLGQNMGIVKPAMAQGIGFSAFSPVLTLWKTFRDIAYLGFVVIFVIVGFMIMFRKKIDPRTVVTVQEALPRIVVTLLLVTFSYAIVGLIIDMVEFSIRLIANLVVDGKLLGVGNPTKSINDLMSSNIFKLVNPLRNVGGIANAIGEVKIGIDVPGLDWLAKITVGIVLWIAGFFIMFKIFFALLGAYVAIVLSVIFAPFQLLVGAFPGSNAGFGSWLKSIIANVAVFPVTFVMLAISAILQSGPTLAKCDPNLMAFGGAGGSALWCTGAKEYNVLWTPVGINLGTAVGYLAGFGILFAIPKVTEIVRETLQQKPSPLETAGGEGLRGALKEAPLVGGLLGKAI